ncbi:MAG TPA: sigma-70 family RNA polymerase sigma factor [Candidatus Angelobacter sp.]|nr:sigma-70 family RNA polymerase sigma factor [Candidatus Angelobacter sp.]
MAWKAGSQMTAGVAAIDLSGQLNEPQLVAAAKGGDDAAFGELYSRYSQRIFRITRRITRNHQDAEDTAQECFLSALVHLEDFDGRSSFSTWLTRIAINSALMKLRKNRARPEIEISDRAGAGDDFVPYESVDPRPDPEEHFADRQRERIVAGAVCKLRPKLRQIIEICRLRECSIRETAQVLRISASAAKSRLHHARVALHRMPALQAMRRRASRAA